MEFAFLGARSGPGWEDWIDYGVDVADGVTLRRDAVPTYRSSERILDEASGDGETLRVVDVAVDSCGQLFVLSETGGVFRYDPERGSHGRMSCLWTGDLPAEPTAICITGGTLYVSSVVPNTSTTGSTDPEPTGRIHAFSRSLSQTRWIATDPFVHPLRIVTTGGVVYVLDAGTERVADPAIPSEPFLAKLADDGTAEPVLEDLEDPRDLTVDDDGRLVVLDRPEGTDDGSSRTPRIRVFDPDPSDPSIDEASGGGATTDVANATQLTELETERIHRTVSSDPFEIVGTEDSIDPVCLAAAGSDELIIGVGPSFPGERLLYRYLRRESGFERVAGFDRSCVRLVLEPHRSRNENEPASAVEHGPETTRRLYAVDGDDRTLHALEQVAPNRRAIGGRDTYSGRIVSRLDSGEAGMRWHRLTGDIVSGGPGTQVRLHYYATDDADDVLEGLQSIDDIGETFAGRLREANVLGVRGLAALDAEMAATLARTTPTRAQPWITTARRRAAKWTAFDRPDPRDALLDAVGRYLWIELELVGGEFSTPAVDTFGAYFPRQSYLRYLPAVYREDEASADFLERFLSVFESVFVDVDEELKSFTRYLDPYGTSPEYVSWLGSWLATVTDEELPASTKRDLIGQAPALFKMRGTREGLITVLEYLLKDVQRPALDWETVRRRETRHLERLVHTGRIRADEAEDASHAAVALYEELDEAYRREPSVYLWTYADLDCIDTAQPLEDYRRLVSCPHCFLVLIGSELDDARLRVIKRVVEAERPAHTVGRAAELRAELRLGGNAFLGVNTTLTEDEFVVETATLGADSVLTEREQHAQLGFKSRLGRDAELS